ncbi:hypothetical protein V7075_28220, partial [Neobacillus drentensis]|uniref:hypothetical protein n=1 Tax=Neobacillus drentensis TaxID=220684 RepID=UPI002FFF1148
GVERGFSKEVYFETLKLIPFMWVIVVLLVRLVAGPLVGMVMPKFVGQTDGFNARVLLNILLNVTVLSLLLSIIGTWVGMKEVSMAPFQNILHIWPRNFGIAFWVEMLIAQPIARFAMKKLHHRQSRKAVNA